MRKALKQFGLGVAVLVMTASAAWAQVCSGAVPISNTSRFNAGGALMLADDATGLAGIGQGGNSNFFGTLQIGRIDFDDDLGEFSTTMIGGRAGAQFTYEMERPLHVCPIFTVQRQWASDIEDVEDLGFTATSFSFGVDVGLLAAQSGNMEIVPTAGLYFGRVSGRAELEDFELFDESETGGLFNLGVGLIFNQRISVTPLVSFPFGFGEGTDASFSITALYAFGSR